MESLLSGLSSQFFKLMRNEWNICNVSFLPYRDLYLKIQRIEENIYHEPAFNTVWDGLLPIFTSTFTTSYRGYLYMNTTGSYQFIISHRDGLKVFIDHQPAYINWGCFKEVQQNNITITFDTIGYHHIISPIFCCSSSLSSPLSPLSNRYTISVYYLQSTITPNKPILANITAGTFSISPNIPLGLTFTAGIISDINPPCNISITDENGYIVTSLRFSKYQYTYYSFSAENTVRFWIIDGDVPAGIRANYWLSRIEKSSTTTATTTVNITAINDGGLASITMPLTVTGCSHLPYILLSFDVNSNSTAILIYLLLNTNVDIGTEQLTHELCGLNVLKPGSIKGSNVVAGVPDTRRHGLKVSGVPLGINCLDLKVVDLLHGVA
ncbi:hypothetical protein WA158_006943 [Blastocystis sp. Blastoise]